MLTNFEVLVKTLNHDQQYFFNVLRRIRWYNPSLFWFCLFLFSVEL